MGIGIGERVRILISIKVWILVIRRCEEIRGGGDVSGSSLAATHAYYLLIIIYIYYVNLTAVVKHSRVGTAGRI